MVLLLLEVLPWARDILLFVVVGVVTAIAEVAKCGLLNILEVLSCLFLIGVGLSLGFAHD